MSWFSLFKKVKDNVHTVVKSEQVNRPGFDEYFKWVVDYESVYWGDDGHLYQGDDNKLIVSFARFNLRMNEGVCKYFGEEKCREVAKAKGWYYDDFPFGAVFDKNGGTPILWYTLHDELVKL